MNSTKPSPVYALLFCAAVSGCFCVVGKALSQDSGKSISRGVHILEPPTSAPPDGSNSVLTPARPSNGGTGRFTPAVPTSPPATPAEQKGAPPPAPSAPPAADSANAPLLVPAPSNPTASEQGSDTGAAPMSTPSTSSPPADDSATHPATAANPDNVIPPSAASPANAGSSAPNPSTAGLTLHVNELDPAVLSSAIKVPDTAGLSVQITPGPEIAAGSPVSFEITTKKPGYLILVDVNAAGKAVQIYPNPMSLMQPKDVREKVNFIRPGRVVRLPDATNPYSGFEFVAARPQGTAMVVALLSERPVQLLDLPDLPGPASRGAATVEDFVKFASALRVPNRDRDGVLEDAHWSFAVTPYAVR